MKIRCIKIRAKLYLGYYELCFNRNSYENLIVELDEETKQNYFR